MEWKMEKKFFEQENGMEDGQEGVLFARGARQAPLGVSSWPCSFPSPPSHS